LNYYSPNIKGVINERPADIGGRKKQIDMVDESMNVSDVSQSEAVITSDSESNSGKKNKQGVN
jgi:hypothetical protein